MTRKRRAVKVMPYQGPRPVIQSTFKCEKDNPRYQHPYVKEKNVYCIYCGELAEFVAHLKIMGVTLREKYCKNCLQKYIIQ